MQSASDPFLRELPPPPLLPTWNGRRPGEVVTTRAAKGRYSADRHEGVKLLVTYWHFLDIAWLLMFVAIVL